MSPCAEISPPISVASFNELIRDTIPTADFFNIKAEQITRGAAILRLSFSDKLLRQGGTHGGPSMMALIDLAMYAAVLSRNPDDIGALTTQLAVDLLQRPPASDLLAECRIIGGDDRSAVGRVSIFPVRDPTHFVCISTCTYSMPRS